jgi:hypothetical protein
VKRIESLLHHSFKIILMLFVYFNTPCLYADHDNSLRTDINFNYTINKRFLSTSYVFLQGDKDMSNYNYVELGTGLQYQTSLPWLSFLLWYQQGYSKDDDSQWRLEQKPSININTSVMLDCFKISNQIRYEYRITPDWNDYRLKNTLEIARPDIFLSPYIGWELFYENHDRDVTLNRIRFGIIKNVDSHISLGPYYRVDFSKIDHHWEFIRQLVGFQVTINY